MAEKTNFDEVERETAAKPVTEEQVEAAVRKAHKAHFGRNGEYHAGVVADLEALGLEARWIGNDLAVRVPQGGTATFIVVQGKLMRPPKGSQTKADAIETVDMLSQHHSVVLPEGCLTQQVQSWVDETHEDEGFDKGALAVAFLAAASMVIHSGTLLRIKKEWVIRPIIWSNIIGEPGTQKSPIIRASMGYVERLERELHGARAQAISEAIRDQGLEGDEAVAFAKAYPPARQIMANDATIEALQELLSAPEQENGGLGIYRDELAGLIGSMNQYRGGKGSDRQLFLEFHFGGPQKKNRVSKTSTHRVECSAVSIVGGMQPDTIRRVCKDGVDDGWMQRWLYATLTPREFRPIIFDDDEHAVVEVQRRWMFSRFRGLLRQEPRTYHLSQDAKAELNAVLEKYHVMTSRSEVIKAWYAKLADHWGRVALIFHCIENPDEVEISGKIARTVTRLFEEFLMPSAEAAFMIMEGHSNLEMRRAAEAVLRASARGETTIDTKKLKSHVRQLKDRHVDEIERIVSPLVGAGWITPIQHDPRAGRKPPASWAITQGLADIYREHLERAVAVERAVKAKMKNGGEQ